MNNIFDIVKTTNATDLFNDETTKEPRKFFGNFIYEGELSILFGDSNAGKSILANDIAFFVSGGYNSWGFESPNVPSLYIDMEMTGQQFANRYQSGKDLIPKTYYRATVDTLAASPEMVLQAIKATIISRQGDADAPKFIVIDNITNGFGSIHSSKQMRELIGEFKNLKDRFGLTILLIAHCPKRQQGKPITQDNLGGSKMILNFVDSAFAISTTVLPDKAVRYVKQIKCRACAKYDEVAGVSIHDEPYLNLGFWGWRDEENFLTTMYYRESPIPPEKETEVIKMLMDGISKWKIALKVGVSYADVSFYARVFDSYSNDINNNKY